MDEPWVPSVAADAPDKADELGERSTPRGSNQSALEGEPRADDRRLAAFWAKPQFPESGHSCCRPVESVGALIEREALVHLGARPSAESAPGVEHLDRGAGPRREGRRGQPRDSATEYRHVDLCWDSIHRQPLIRRTSLVIARMSRASTGRRTGTTKRDTSGTRQQRWGSGLEIVV